MKKQKYEVRPASVTDAGFFYALTPEDDAAQGAIGHVRIDFGRNGNEWWTTWHPRGPEKLNSPEFRTELNDLVEQLRQEGMLKDLRSMERFCQTHGGEIEDGWSRSHGYTVKTENYLYCIRCSPVQGDYHCYLSCFDRRQQARMQAVLPVGRAYFSGGEVQEFQTGEQLLKTIRDELPHMATTGFRYEILTDDAGLRKAADDLLYDFYGERNPASIKDYTEPIFRNTGMEMKF